MIVCAARLLLRNHRGSESFGFEWAGMSFIATIARFVDCLLAEIFLTNHMLGSLETLRRALVLDAQGFAGGPLGTALDLADRSQA